MAECGASGGGSSGDSLDKSITLPPDEIFRNLENAKRFAIDIGSGGPAPGRGPPWRAGGPARGRRRTKGGGAGRAASRAASRGACALLTGRTALPAGAARGSRGAGCGGGGEGSRAAARSRLAPSAWPPRGAVRGVTLWARGRQDWRPDDPRRRRGLLEDLKDLLPASCPVDALRDGAGQFVPSCGRPRRPLRKSLNEHVCCRILISWQKLGGQRRTPTPAAVASGALRAFIASLFSGHFESWAWRISLSRCPILGGSKTQ